MNLLDRTRQLIQESELPRARIVKGAGVGLEWFKKFKQGVIDDPGVDKIQRVHDFLVFHVASSSNPPRVPTVAKFSKRKQSKRDITSKKLPELRVRKSPNRVPGAA